MRPGIAPAQLEWISGGALFLLGLGLAGVLAPLWLHVEDDGLYMYQANSILRGGVPYRDFLHYDPPLGSAWHALLLALFGNDVLSLRLGVLPFKAALLPAVYWLSRPLMPRGPALLAALMVPVVDTNLTYTVAHIAINALGCGVVAVVLLAAWLRRPWPGWLVAAGVVLGIMTGFKQNMGLFLLGGVILWLLDPQGRSPDPANEAQAAQPAGRGWPGLALRGAGWGAALVSTFWLLRPHLEPGVIGSLVVPILALAGAAFFAPASRAGRASLRTLGRRVLPLLAGFVAAILPWSIWAVAGAGLPAVSEGLFVAPAQLGDVWFVPLRQPIPAFWWLLGLFAGGIGVAAASLVLARRRSGLRWAPLLTWGSLLAWGVALLFFSPLLSYTAAGLPYVWLYFNLLVFWPAFLLAQRLPAGPQRNQALLLLLTSAFLALEMYPQMRRVYANWCFALFLPLAAWVLWTLAQALGRIAPPGARGRIGVAPLVAVLVLPMLSAGWILDWRLNAWVDVPASLRTGQVVARDLAPLDLPHFHLYETLAHRDLYHRVAAGITSRMRPGEPIYCFYRQVAFYVATDRPAGVRNVYPPPGTSIIEGIAIRGQLEQAGVRVILAENTIFLPDGPVDVLFPGRVAAWAIPIRDYLTDQFRPVEALGDWTLWERR